MIKKIIMKRIMIGVITVLSIMLLGQGCTQKNQNEKTMKNTNQAEQYTFKLVIK